MASAVITAISSASDREGLSMELGMGYAENPGIAMLTIQPQAMLGS